MIATRTSNRGAAWWLLVVALVVSALVSRLCYLVRPFDSDGAMFIYMGRLISEGGRFGHDIVDNKFPTVGLMTSAAWRVFGPHWGPYVILGAAMSMSSAFVLARAAHRNIRADAGRATLLAAIVYLNFNVAVFGGFQLETPQALFASLAAAAAMEAITQEDARDAFVVGLCAFTAALLKPTGMIVAGAFAVAVVSYASTWRAVLRLGIAALCGAIIPIAVAMTYLIAADNLRDMPALAKQISSYAANSAWNAQDWVKPIVVLVLGGFPLFVRGVIFRRDRFTPSPGTPGEGRGEGSSSLTEKDPLPTPLPAYRERERERTDPRLWLFLLAWLALESIGVAMQRRMYAYHFMVLAPALALVFGALPRKARTGSLAASLVPLSLFSLYCATLVFQIGANRPTLAASDYLKAHATPTDTAWKDDAARLLLETGLHSASRYPLTFLFANTDTAPLEYGQQILHDFQVNEPKYIVLRSDLEGYVKHQRANILELERFPTRSKNFQIAWDRIAQYVHENYVVEATVDRQDVWRRKEKPRDANPWASVRD